MLRVSADLASRLAPLYIEVQSQVLVSCCLLHCTTIIACIFSLNFQAAKANAAVSHAAGGSSAAKAGISLPLDEMMATLCLARGEFAVALQAVGLDGSGRFRDVLNIEALYSKLHSAAPIPQVAPSVAVSNNDLESPMPARQPLQSQLAAEVVLPSAAPSVDLKRRRNESSQRGSPSPRPCEEQGLVTEDVQSNLDARSGTTEFHEEIDTVPNRVSLSPVVSSQTPFVKRQNSHHNAASPCHLALPLHSRRNPFQSPLRPRVSEAVIIAPVADLLEEHQDSTSDTMAAEVQLPSTVARPVTSQKIFRSPSPGIVEAQVSMAATSAGVADDDGGTLLHGCIVQNAPPNVYNACDFNAESLSSKLISAVVPIVVEPVTDWASVLDGLL